MVSETAPIPRVDIRALFGGNASELAATAAALGAAARGYGFLYVTGHRVPAVLFDRLLDAAQRFFAQPLAEKMRVYIGHSRNHRGYVPEGEEVFAGGTKDAKEAYDCARDLPVDDPDFLAGNPLLGPNQWPAVAGFEAAVTTYYDATFEVGRVLLRGFALALHESPGLFDPVLTKPPSQLINAPPISDAYLVNIGDMLELWTNGTFVATSHRIVVIRPAGQAPTRPAVALRAI